MAKFHTGSPPHARGKVQRLPGGQGGPGITPARAGKSQHHRKRWRGGQDHPRTRGEKFAKVGIDADQMGSPPHARGKGKAGPGRFKGWGITPARAGKSCLVSTHLPASQDHPRTRGEKRMMLVVVMPTSGSPPHARGKGHLFKVQINGLGITPARAGKSSRLCREIHLKLDHPRTRGEKDKLLIDQIGLEGSPPHARGKGVVTVPTVMVGGITPARAGKRYHLLAITDGNRDHPRTRGEKGNMDISAVVGQGSPPHARGKGTFSPTTYLGCRITPARAGKRWGKTCPPFPAQDHPRTRGEKGLQQFATVFCTGSPPHARGKAAHNARAGKHGGITPARAGKRLNGSLF